MECYPCRKCGAKESVRGNKFSDESLRDDHEDNCVPGNRNTKSVPIKTSSIGNTRKRGLESSKGIRFANKVLRYANEDNCTSIKRNINFDFDVKSTPAKKVDKFTDESLRDDHEDSCVPGQRNTNAVPIQNNCIDNSKLFPCRKCGVEMSKRGIKFTDESLRYAHEDNCVSRRNTKPVPIKTSSIDARKLFPCRKRGPESSKGNRFANKVLRYAHEFNCVPGKGNTKFEVKFTPPAFEHCDDSYQQNMQLFPCRRCGVKTSRHPHTKKVTSFTDVEMRNTHEGNCKHSFHTAEFIIRGSDQTLQTIEFLREVSTFIHDTAEEREDMPIKIINITLISTDETGTDMPKLTQFFEEKWPLSKMLQAGLWTNVKTITCPSGRPTNKDLKNTTKLSKLTILNLPGHPSVDLPTLRGSWIQRLHDIKIVKSNTVETLRRLCEKGVRLNGVDVSVLGPSISVSAILQHSRSVYEMRIRLPAGMAMLPEDSGRLRQCCPSLRRLTVGATGGVITHLLPFLEEDLSPPGASGLISIAFNLSPKPEERPCVTELWGMSSMVAEFPGTRRWKAAVASLKELTIDIDAPPDVSLDMLSISGATINDQRFVNDVAESKDLRDWCGRCIDARLIASVGVVHVTFRVPSHGM